MNKFDRLENFIKSQIDEKGALAIAKEVEALMYKNGLTEGPTLSDIFKSTRFSEEHYLNEEICGFELVSFIANQTSKLNIRPRGFKLGSEALEYSENFAVAANDDDYVNAEAA